MVTYQYYTQKMEDTFKLIGIDNKANREMAKAIYDRIKTNYENEDLDGALDSIMQSDFPKINFPILLRCLNTKRTLRFEEKSKSDKQTGEETSRKFWNMETKENCISRNCRECSHLAGRCDTIAKHTLEAIRIMINRKWRTWRKDEEIQVCYSGMRKEQHEHNGRILDELNRQFPGVGFGVNYDLAKKQVYTRDELRTMYSGHKAAETKGSDFPAEDAHDF